MIVSFKFRIKDRVYPLDIRSGGCSLVSCGLRPFRRAASERLLAAMLVLLAGIQVYNAMTDGSLIVGVLALVGTILGVLFAWPTASEWLYRYWPKLKFADRPWSKTDAPSGFQKSKTIAIGTTELYAVFTPRTAVSVQKIDVRFVNGHFRRWRRNAYPDQIEVVSLDLHPTNGEVEIESNGVGGYVARFAKPRVLVAGEELYLHVGAMAKSPWTGLLSVEIKGMEIRPRVRRRVSVER